MTMAERLDVTEEWREVDAWECIERGESRLLLGRPGTGKSTLTCELVKLLEAGGEQVVCAAKTMWQRVAYPTECRLTI